MLATAHTRILKFVGEELAAAKRMMAMPEGLEKKILIKAIITGIELGSGSAYAAMNVQRPTDVIMQ